MIEHEILKIKTQHTYRTYAQIKAFCPKHIRTMTSETIHPSKIFEIATIQIKLNCNNFLIESISATLFTLLIFGTIL